MQATIEGELTGMPPNLIAMSTVCSASANLAVALCRR